MCRWAIRLSVNHVISLFSADTRLTFAIHTAASDQSALPLTPPCTSRSRPHIVRYHSRGLERLFEIQQGEGKEELALTPVGRSLQLQTRRRIQTPRRLACQCKFGFRRRGWNDTACRGYRLHLGLCSARLRAARGRWRGGR